MSTKHRSKSSYSDVIALLADCKFIKFHLILTPTNQHNNAGENCRKLKPFYLCSMVELHVVACCSHYHVVIYILTYVLSIILLNILYR